MKELAREWFSFVLEVLPADMTEHQQKHLRRAFYAGALSTMSIQGRLADATGEQKRAAILGLKVEIEAFFEEVKQRRA